MIRLRERSGDHLERRRGSRWLSALTLMPPLYVGYRTASFLARDYLRSASEGDLGVKQFRLFVIDDDGHIRRAPEIIEGLDDREAIGKAVQLLDGQYLELWDLERLVIRLAPAQMVPDPPRMQ
jgi:hypothetical protein